MLKEILKQSSNDTIISFAETMIRRDYEKSREEEPTRIKKITQFEANTATMMLMTGPKAQRPSWRAVRKAVHRIRHGLEIKGSWRGWPTVKGDIT